MSSSDQDSMSESCSPFSLESPRSSPSQQVPQLANYLTELTCMDKNARNMPRGQAGPFLRIIEQPQNHFRFRYKSEMVGTHGCILGKTSASNKNKTHPTVELMNYNRRALIRCRLAQHLKDAEHPHQLLEDEQEDRDVSAEVPEDRSYRVGFPGMGIIHTAKKDVPNLLFKKYTKDLQRPFNNRELMTRCESEAKGINLNIVRLRFSAHDIDTDQEICEPVLSEPIHNMKSAATNDLKICRTSRINGNPKGGDDVFFLVEKVNKKNIEIRFVERNDAGDEVWSAKAHFLQTDVHHQYAIVFRTPAYKDQHIASDVKVGVELFRPSDGRCSDPVEFTYRADPAARHNKKRKPNTSPFSSWDSSLGTGSIKSQSDLPDPVSNMFVNSNMEVDNDISGMPNAMPFVGPQGPQPTPYEVHYSVGPMMPQINSFPELHLTSAELKNVISSPSEMQEFTGYLQEYLRDNSDYYGGVPEKLDPYNMPLQTDSGRGKARPQGPDLSPSKSEKNSPHKAGEESNNEYTAVFSPEHGEEVRKLVKEICDLIRSKTGMKKNVITEKLERLFQLRLSNGDTFLHMTLCNNRSSFDYITKLVHSMKMPHLLNLTNDLGQTILHSAVIYDIPELMSFLVSKGCDPSIGDQDGNTPVHLAVKYQACLQPLLAAIQSCGSPCDLDAQNKDKQTALHLAAVPGPDPDAVASAVHSIELLLQHGAHRRARDAERRTPLHLAAYDDCLPVVRALLAHTPAEDVDAPDGGGLSALQVACGGPVRGSTAAIVQLLLDKQADPLAGAGRAASAWRLAADKPPLRALLAPRVGADADVKSEPEDEYESADEGEEACLSELSLYVADVSRLLDGSGAWRALAQRLHHDALCNWFQHTASPTRTLLSQVKASQDSSITSKTLILMLEELGQTEAARLIRSRIGAFD